MLNDMRDLKNKAVLLNSKKPGHAQVLCNPLRGELIASGHAGIVCVWDVRRPARPVSTLMVHLSKSIGRMDWSPVTGDEIAACVPAQSDVKIFRLSNANPLTVSTPSGVGSIRYRADGRALLASGADSVVRLISTTDRSNSVLSSLACGAPAER
jgi:WD40 repeat protein